MVYSFLMYGIEQTEYRYGVKTRPDRLPGFALITPTKLSHRGDNPVRVDRVRICSPFGRVIASLLVDEMGVPFADNLPGSEDDLKFLRKVYQPNGFFK